LNAKNRTHSRAQRAQTGSFGSSWLGLPERWSVQGEGRRVFSGPSTRAEFLSFDRGLSATACPNPEAQSAEVEFCRRPAKPEKFGKPEGPQGVGLEKTRRPSPGLRTQQTATQQTATQQTATQQTATQQTATQQTATQQTATQRTIEATQEHPKVEHLKLHPEVKEERND